MKTNEKLIAITAIVAIFAAGMLMGCIDKEVAEIPVPITNEDFKKIVACAADDIAYQLEDIGTAQDNGDFVAAKIELATFDASVVEYISIFEEMNVAENSLPCKKATISAFEEIQLFGDCVGVYLENPTVDKYVRYNAQAINMSAQLKIAIMLAENL